MKKLVKVLVTFVLLLGITTGFTIDKVEASQASYKLTAYNSKGKKVYVNAPKNMVVTKVSGKSWYKGSLKYTSYKKVSGKWKKYTKTSTVYIPSKYVKGTTKKTYAWVKRTRSLEATFKVDKQNQLNELTGKDMIVTKGTTIDGVQANDSKGKYVPAVALSDAVMEADTYVYDDFDGDGNYDDYCSEDGWDKVCGDGKGDIDNDVDGDKIIDRKDFSGGKENWSVYTDTDIDNDGITNDVDDDNDNDGIKNDIDKSRLVDTGKAKVSFVDYDHKLISSKTTYKTTVFTRAYTKIYVAPVKNGITLSEYNKLKKGMTYKQVVDIIGENGKLEASYDGYGTTYKSYSWKQKGVEYAEASIDFENNKLTSMWQYGLE